MLVCIVDDMLENARMMERALDSLECVVFGDADAAYDYLIRSDVDVLVTDQKMPNMTGLELIKRVKAHNDDLIAIVVSAYTDQDDLIDAVNSNLVFRYIVKPFPLAQLRSVVNAAIDQLQAERRERRLRDELSVQNRLLLEENGTLRAGSQPILDLFAGNNPAMLRIKELALLYSLSDEPVLITGETGTGKELLARIVHHFSPRRDRPFVAVNCSNLGEHLLESTLFGHVRGAFTGADRDKKGLVHDAAGGTLFLDEIGDLPMHLQPKLLRFVQFHTFTPVGSNKDCTADVRLISATNRNLRTRLDAGEFRADLFYRINTFQIHLPPLRQRRSDILPIARRIARARGIGLLPMDSAAIGRLEAHQWPGNVRELANVLERLMMLAHSMAVPMIDEHVVELALADAAGHVPAPPDHAATDYSPSQTVQPSAGAASNRFTVSAPPAGQPVDLRVVVSTVEAFVIEHVLAQEQGNLSRSAARLGLSRQGLRNKLRARGASADDVVNASGVWD